jgi:5-aminopentanamidase
MRIALLHLAPKVGELASNRQMIEAALDVASQMEADWVVTPELCLSGYEFADVIGVQWCSQQPDPWVQHFCRLAARLKITLFLSHPERDSDTAKLYNTVFVIGPNGEILGRHRKIHVVPGIEAWASRGEKAVPILTPASSVGVLVCADAYTADVANTLKAQGAKILISSAAWTPHPHGPDGCWEKRSFDTGLPLFVCNRTGIDRTLDFTDAETIVAKDGVRLVTFSSPESAVVLIQWDTQSQSIVRQFFQPVHFRAEAPPAVQVDSEACPLCSGSNACGLKTDPAAKCWCFNEHFPQDLLERVPPEAVRRTCICAGCLKAFQRAAAAQ